MRQREEPPRRRDRGPRPDNPIANRQEGGVGEGGSRSVSDVRNGSVAVRQAAQSGAASNNVTGTVTVTEHRLSLLTYKQIEQRLYTNPPTPETTGIQAGYQLGLQYALKILREFTVGL